MKHLKRLLSSAVPTAAEMHCVSCQQRKLVIKTSFRTRVKFWELPLKEMGETKSECIYFSQLSDALCRGPARWFSGSKCLACVVWQTFPGGVVAHRSTHHQIGNLWQTKADITKVQLGDPMTFSEIIKRVWVKGNLQKQKWLQDSCITKAHPGMGDSSQNREPGAHRTAFRHLSRLESALSRRLSWCEALLNSWMVSASCRQLVWTQSLPSFYYLL